MQDTSSGTLSNGTYTSTVSGTDLAGNAYSGTESITFTIDASSPTVTLTDTDSDNLVSVSEVVTITAGFSEAMTATPTISITGIVTNVIMTPVSGTNSYTYAGILLLELFLMGLIPLPYQVLILPVMPTQVLRASPLLLMLHRLRLL